MHTDYDCSVDKKGQGRLSLSQLFGVAQIAGLGLQKLKCGRPHKNILHRTLRLSLRGYGAFLLTVCITLGELVRCNAGMVGSTGRSRA
mgnify:CR=1 FL=1